MSLLAKSDLPWVDDCIRDSVLHRLPAALMDDSSSESDDDADDDDCASKNSLRKGVGDRLAIPDVKPVYYPDGAPPDNWFYRNTYCTPTEGLQRIACTVDYTFSCCAVV